MKTFSWSGGHADVQQLQFPQDKNVEPRNDQDSHTGPPPAGATRAGILWEGLLGNILFKNSIRFEKNKALGQRDRMRFLS